MKRDREDSIDRDASEIRQPRTGGSQSRQGRGGKSERGPRKDPRQRKNGEQDSQEPYMKVQFEILRSMVGAVIGMGGGTVQGIRNRTGATVHIHSSTPKDKETSVELRGTKKQIEDAYNELKAVMATVDEDYTEKHDGLADASMELRTLPKMVGCLIGKGGSTIRGIEEQSGAKVEVERKAGSNRDQQDGEEFQEVHIYGSLDCVSKAHELVQEALQTFDPAKAKAGRRSTQSTTNSQTGVVVTDLNANAALSQNAAQQALIPQAQQSPIVIQAPAGGLPPTPTILVLQADGTYVPAQVVSQFTNPSAPQSNLTHSQQTHNMGVPMSSIQGNPAMVSNVHQLQANPQAPTLISGQFSNQAQQMPMRQLPVQQMSNLMSNAAMVPATSGVGFVQGMGLPQNMNVGFGAVNSSHTVSQAQDFSNNLG